jgi:hypothetical protein
MSDSEEKLTRKQELAIVALLSHPTLREAARTTSLGESTLLRWLSVPAFRSRYDSERRALLEGAKNALRGAALGSVETLATMQHDPATPPGARVTAAKAILDLCLRIQESDDILLRLEKLEAATERKQ